MSRAAYVEDDPDGIDAPPHAPSPPPNPPRPKSEQVNVFDYLVNDQTPNASRVSLGGSKEQMSMVRGAPSVFTETSDNQVARRHDHEDEHEAYNSDFDNKGFSYGAQPIPPTQEPNASYASFDFKTPAARHGAREANRPSHSRQDSGNLSDRKRKRGHVDPLNLSAAGSNGQRSVHYELEGDTLMSDPPKEDTPANLAHSGLTGGLNRLLSDSAFPPSPDYSDEKEKANGRADPMSPLKRSKHAKETDSNGLGISIKGRAGRIMSLMGVAGAPAVTGTGTSNNEKALMKIRRRTSSSESGQQGPGDDGRTPERRPRKHHKVHRTHGTSSASTQHRSSRHHRPSQDPSRSSSRTLKAIEYHYPSSNSDDSENDHKAQLVKYDADSAATQKNRAEHFLSFVTKGPDSEKGCSMNKCLKRYHRDTVGGRGRGGGREAKAEEEKELWRGLRLRKNDRGEIVVFF